MTAPTLLLLAKSAIAAAPRDGRPCRRPRGAQVGDARDARFFRAGFALAPRPANRACRRGHAAGDNPAHHAAHGAERADLGASRRASVARGTYQARPSDRDRRPAPLGEANAIAELLARLADAAPDEDVLAHPTKVPDASVVPDQHRRVLVCMGSPCNDCTAALIWHRLRAEQDRLRLVRSARAR